MYHPQQQPTVITFYQDTIVQKITKTRTASRREIPWQNLNPAPFYLMSKEYWSLSSVSEPLCHVRHSSRLHVWHDTSVTISATWDTVDPAKQDGVVYRITWECGNVYIQETRRPVHELDQRTRERYMTPPYPDLRLFWTRPRDWPQSDLDRDPHWYTRRVKEAFHLRLYPNKINRDSGIEIPDAWMPAIKNTITGKLHNNGPLRNFCSPEQWNYMRGSKCKNHRRPSRWKWWSVMSKSHRLKKTSSRQLKCHDLLLKW